MVVMVVLVAIRELGMKVVIVMLIVTVALRVG